MLTCNIFVPAGQMQTSPHTFLNSRSCRVAT